MESSPPRRFGAVYTRVHHRQVNTHANRNPGWCVGAVKSEPPHRHAGDDDTHRRRVASSMRRRVACLVCVCRLVRRVNDLLRAISGICDKHTHTHALACASCRYYKWPPCACHVVACLCRCATTNHSPRTAHRPHNIERLLRARVVCEPNFADPPPVSHALVSRGRAGFIGVMAHARHGMCESCLAISLSPGLPMTHTHTHTPTHTGTCVRVLGLGVYVCQRAQEDGWRWRRRRQRLCCAGSALAAL